MPPRIVRVTKDPELNMFINADVHKKPSCPQILQLRPDNVIYFANAEYTIEHLLSHLDEQLTPVKFLLIDFQAVGFIDITGIDELRVLLDEVKARGFEVAFMNIHIPVKQVFDSSGLIKELEPSCLIENRGDAITLLFQKIDHKYCKATCPYNLFHECDTVK